MAKGVLIAGVVLGIVGLVWSILVVLAFVVLAALFGGTPGVVAWIPGIGVPLGIVAIAGGVVGGRWERLGSLILLVAGLLAPLGGFIIYTFLTDLSLPMQDAILRGLVIYWWAILLIIVGGVLFVKSGRARPAAEGPQAGSP